MGIIRVKKYSLLKSFRYFLFLLILIEGNKNEEDLGRKGRCICLL